MVEALFEAEEGEWEIEGKEEGGTLLGVLVYADRAPPDPDPDPDPNRDFLVVFTTGLDFVLFTPDPDPEPESESELGLRLVMVRLWLGRKSSTRLSIADADVACLLAPTPALRGKDEEIPRFRDRDDDQADKDVVREEVGVVDDSRYRGTAGEDTNEREKRSAKTDMVVRFFLLMVDDDDDDETKETSRLVCLL